MQRAYDRRLAHEVFAIRVGLNRFGLPFLYVSASPHGFRARSRTSYLMVRPSHEGICDGILNRRGTE